MSKVGKMTMLMGMQLSLVGPLRYINHITSYGHYSIIGSGTETNLKDQNLHPDKNQKYKNEHVFFLILIFLVLSQNSVVTDYQK